MALTFSDIFKFFFAIIFPPLGVFLEKGCGKDLLINVLLTILGLYICGIIHAYESEVRKVTEGDIVYELNDTVYLAPENVNEAYYLGRIMEFVKDQNNCTTQAKIAWYLRPRDILGKKKNFDSRLLLATMHYDVNPISSIRGKCTIKHTRRYFLLYKLYDRYSQRLYDVVPVEEIRNLSDTLIQAFYPYKFIIVDDGKASDFVEKRECAVCEKWVDNDVLLDCLHCHRKFHMYCIDPPLTKKPPKGYAWECLDCLGILADLKEEEENENNGLNMDEFRNIHHNIKDRKKIYIEKLKKIIESAKAKEKKNEILPKRNIIPPNADQFEEPKWPYIYFGDISRRYSFLNDNLDPTDIFPKTCKNENQERSHNNNSKSKGRKKRGKFKEETPVGLRGSKYELVYSKPDDWEDEKVNNYVKNVKECHPEIQNMDLFDRALLELHKNNYDIDNSFSIMKKITLKDLDLPTWSKTEIKQFENGIIKYGHELQYVKQEVPTKRRKDVVQYFYRWKKTKRYRLIYSQFCKVHRPGKVFADLENNSDDKNKDKDNKDNIKKEEDNDEENVKSSINKDDNDDEDEDDENKLLKTESIMCSNCNEIVLINENSISKTMCEECLIYWLKYYTPKPVHDKKNKDNGKLKRKREEEKQKIKKRNTKKVRSQSQLSSSEHELSNSEEIVKFKNENLQQVEEPEPEEIIIPCSICLDSYDTHWNPIVQCSVCKLRVHKSCYGIIEEETMNWQCSRCKNKDNQRSSMNYTCVLCNIKKNEEEDAVKLTFSNNWAHVLCSLFIPEVKYGNTRTMEPIEFINLIDEKKWKKKCCICDESYGVCVTCHWKGCSKSFHVTCASTNHQRFSIEESGRNGNLYAAIYCFDHTKALLENESSSEMELSISQIIPEICKCHINNTTDIIFDDDKMNEIQNPDDDNIIQCRKCNEKISPVWWKRKELLEMINELIDEEFDIEEEEEKEEEEEEKEKDKEDEKNKKNEEIIEDKMEIDSNEHSLIKEKAKKECINYLNHFYI
ncbi:hypothetical protein BCR32DRAFT_293253 [Anaeromyces robustus]|uniref:BAH-domain-containing protein n=1 Tax=Anaeromyces robustus TaxID=1754192 RepID=A0A1Y1X6W8_9FUNG|nr:hypothetical protein BCR32DRAFT_298503 [Anaeromyces robustus]ORX81511.1 hypothetical protein BCR32DRAFT_293253 [Anaeromyces robustus]|eukprot:ORX63235.1 hypothetical protein BCR32DRAFT_298503 [Anaeromyces robustus]